ncbi:MAG: hypothetical protein Q7S40_32130 [Opitutaceae bacterium]|nr:hypothetical protein [Opitutaceae bacterium]
MKFVEEQLINALRETPPETDCSVSTNAMEMVGVRSRLEQQRWLSSKRPAAGDRSWQLIGEHWHFAPRIEPDEDVTRSSSALYSIPLRQTPRPISPIVVKPVRSLPGRVTSRS